MDTPATILVSLITSIITSVIASVVTVILYGFFRDKLLDNSKKPKFTHEHDVLVAHFQASNLCVIYHQPGPNRDPKLEFPRQTYAAGGVRGVEPSAIREPQYLTAFDEMVRHGIVQEIPGSFTKSTGMWEGMSETTKMYKLSLDFRDRYKKPLRTLVSDTLRLR